jgi:hypothetical protein
VGDGLLGDAELLADESRRYGRFQAGTTSDIPLRELGDGAGVLEEHRAVLLEAKKIKLKYERARALDGIAACLRSTDLDEARRHWLRALVLYREMGVPERAEVERELAGLAHASPSTRHNSQAPSAIPTTPETR